jgi:hypothetical protein
MMLDKTRLAAIADLISDYVSIIGVEQYCAETGIDKEDFVPISPHNFDGEIFAIDGSNVALWNWSVSNLNRIRAGYAVYRARNWQRTVITYDDIFLADRKRYSDQFKIYLMGVFGLEAFVLKDDELERLSAYFREMQEYISLADAIGEAQTGDLVLYDGSFTWKKRPLGKVLEKIFLLAEEKNVDLLGISKSSSFSWGSEISRPFLQHTSFAGSMLAPGVPWYVSLQGKNVEPGPDGWDGETYIARLDGRSDQAFRVDVPSYLSDRLGSALGRLTAYCGSAECLGYPHALFRAHRDMRISDHEGDLLKLELLNLLSDHGMSECQLRRALLDYHDVIEMRPRGVL